MPAAGLTSKIVEVFSLQRQSDFIRGIEETLQDRLNEACIRRITSLSVNAKRDGWLQIVAIGLLGDKCKVRIKLINCFPAQADSLGDEISEWIVAEGINPETFRSEQDLSPSDQLFLVLCGEIGKEGSGS